MLPRRKIRIAVVLAVISVATFLGYGMVRAVRHIVRDVPEAYAAWDTGTLLVAYMKAHGNRWPSSWDDLLYISGESSEPITFRGGRDGDTNYAASLRHKVAINWKFSPGSADRSTPVTRLDGSRFRLVWQGAEPNQMVRAQLTSPVPVAR